MTDDDQEFRDLAERTQQLSDLTGTFEWALYIDRANAEVAVHQRALLSGSLSHEKYLREAGWIAGAMAMLELPARQQQQFSRMLEERAAAEEEALA